MGDQRGHPVRRAAGTGLGEGEIQGSERSLPAARALAGLMPGDHVCCVFGSDEEQEAIVGRFGSDSLGRGERLLYLADRSGEPLVRAYLDAAGVDTCRCIASRQLLIRSCDVLSTRGGSFDPEEQIAYLEAERREALSDGFTALAAMAEMSWALAWPGVQERMIDFEREVSRIFVAADIDGVCQYDRRLFPPDLLSELTSVHPTSVCTVQAGTRVQRAGGVVSERDDPPHLELSGEIDISVSGYLAARLREHGRDHAGDVLVDAAGISFIDLGGCRALVRAASELPRRRKLVIENAPRCLIRVLTLCGWASHPQLLFALAGPTVRPAGDAGGGEQHAARRIDA